MGYQRRVFTEEVKAKFEAEGRGTTEGKDWKGWYALGDLSAHFRSDIRFTCLYTQRLVYLPEELIRLCWHALELDDDTVEILECAPLDRPTTQRIAKALGVDHPQDDDSKVDLVMTTSLVAKKMQNGQLTRVPIHCCAAHELEKFRTVEEIELQREYWRLHGQHLEVFTGCPRTIHPQRASNIYTLKDYRLLPPDPPSHLGKHQSQCDHVLQALLCARVDIGLDRWAHDIAPSLQMTTSEVVERLLHMTFKRQVRLDLNVGRAIHQTTFAAIQLTQSAPAEPARLIA